MIKGLLSDTDRTEIVKYRLEKKHIERKPPIQRPHYLSAG